MRLIDADKLLQYQFKNDISYNAFVNLINRQFVIEAKPFVRCKGCKHYSFDGDRYVCCVLSNNYEPIVDLGYDGYCSRGERRED